MRDFTRWIAIWALGLTLVLAFASASAADTDLNISSSQKDQLKALASNTRDRTGREREALRTARRDMLQTYSTYKFDWHKAKDARERISSAQLSLLDVHLDNEIALRNILKEDQFKSLRDMLKKRVRDRHVLMIVPREADILNRIPDKQMLDDLKIPADKQKQLATTDDYDKAVDELRQASESLLGLYANYTLDSAAARKLIDTVHKKQVALLWQQQNRQRLIRRILTQDQFQKVAEEITKRMSERDQKDHKDHKDPHAPSPHAH